MNEFIDQFLIESRELVEQATADLLALEESPADPERLASAFRAFHTLKGAAGIVEFAEMARALHVVEAALSRVRAGEAQMTSGLVGDCLSALDQVLDWLDGIQGAGAPPVDAGPAADAIIARFEAAPAASGSAAPGGAWLPDLMVRGAETARTAFRYAPPAGSYFDGEDPLAVLARVPGLLVLDATLAVPRPSLEDHDPFTCMLIFTGLSTAPADELRAVLASPPGLELVALDPTGPLSHTGRALIEAQLALLAHHEADGFAGRIHAAARTAMAVLRHAGLSADARDVEQALTRAVAAGDSRPLSSALGRILTGERSEPQDSPATAAPPATSTRSLRVEVERVDALVRLVGELQVIKNASGHLATMAGRGADPAFLAQRLREQQGSLERLIAELQRSVVAIRVLPLGHVFRRFPRLVREIGQATGKSVQLVLEGEETEADKTVVESLFEPLLHLLRNAIDHGIETPAERRSLGKQETATVRVRAVRRGEAVEVEVEDDGRGVDVERVRALAVAMGLIDEAGSASLSQDRILGLIFAPGFSTAASVSELSGRGVGMDAVRAAIERLGGQVAVQSRRGQGTTVRLTLPFTVLMTSVVTVMAGGQPYGLSVESVLETVRVPRAAIRPISAARAFVLRDRTIPLFDLSGALDGSAPLSRNGEATVVVVLAGGQPAGLEVDGIGDRMDVMLTPMEGLLSGAFAAAGTALLGDGRVLIVLDVEELLR
jgi:two-component system chemotaxis sensor kinase CheA